MHIEHIIPLARGGRSDESNLCLACAWCNSYKWAQTHGVDSETHVEVPLFNPRTQQWHAHFRWSKNGVHIIGLTATGRATVDTLKMNNVFIVPARRHWVEAGCIRLRFRRLRPVIEDRRMDRAAVIVCELSLGHSVACHLYHQP